MKVTCTLKTNNRAKDLIIQCDTDNPSKLTVTLGDSEVEVDTEELYEAVGVCDYTENDNNDD